MALEQRLDVLYKINMLYDNVIKNLDVACKKYCSSCCTSNVTITTLEGCLIAEHMISKGQSNLIENIRIGISKNRFKPKVTTNGLAAIYMNGNDPPEEVNKHSRKKCPVLKDNLCPIYEVRPFGCRCFMSKHDCSKAQYAEVDTFVMTLNTLFMQFIEHIDIMGFSGNFSDVLLFLASKENRANYKMNSLNHPGADLVPNLKIKILMVPPEHREKIKPVIDGLLNL